MRKPAKRVAVIAAAVALTGGAGVAYAAWNATGAGDGTAKAVTAKALTTADASADAQLYPGGTGDVKIKIANPNPYPVKVTSVLGDGAITATGGIGTCETTGVSFTDQTGLELEVDADSSAEFTLTNAASMSNASEDGCQGATFTIPVKLSGLSNA